MDSCESTSQLRRVAVPNQPAVDMRTTLLGNLHIAGASKVSFAASLQSRGGLYLAISSSIPTTEYMGGFLCCSACRRPAQLGASPTLAVLPTAPFALANGSGERWPPAAQPVCPSRNDPSCN